MSYPVPVIGICAAGSNTGKTTLISKLIPELAKRGIRTSVIKHAHHAFDIDHPGKDSHTIREAGAVQTLVASGMRWALITEMQRTRDPAPEAELASLLTVMNPDYADLILVEGFKHAPIPKIEVHRQERGAPLLSAIAAHDHYCIAIASDTPLNMQTQLPVLDLNDIQRIADFISDNMLQTKFLQTKFLQKR